MNFQSYLCWKPEKVHEVINPDAEAVAEEIFLAVHTDYPLLFSESADQCKYSLVAGSSMT